MPFELPPPELVDLRYAVIFDGRAGLPDERTLNDEISAWLTMRASHGFGEAVRSFLDKEFVTHELVPVGELPLPDRDALEFFGLGEAEANVLDRATHAYLISGHDLPTSPRVGFWTAQALARSLATATSGVILDVDCQRILPEEACSRSLPESGEIRITEHTLVITSAQDDGRCWVTTLGMQRFGLPNLEVRGVPMSMTSVMAPLVNAVSTELINIVSAHTAAAPDEPIRLDAVRLTIQSLSGVTGEPDSDEDNNSDDELTGTADIGLSYTEETDLEPFIRLHPPGEPDADPGPWINACAASLFGQTDQRLLHVPGDSAALDRAKQRAIAELPAVRDRYRSGLPGGSELYVKVGFATDSATQPDDDDADDANNLSEFMWLFVEAWSDDTTLSARLANDPVYRTDLRAGQALQVRTDEICDWMISHTDGSREGGYTIAI
ncbi:MAG: DUF2314 domain-containing protein, partial [Planctomycetota bacterium]